MKDLLIFFVKQITTKFGPKSHNETTQLIKDFYKYIAYIVLCMDA